VATVGDVSWISQVLRLQRLHNAVTKCSAAAAAAAEYYCTPFTQ